LCFAYALLKDAKGRVGSDADVAILEIYAARHSLEALCIFDRFTVELKVRFVASSCVRNFAACSAYHAGSCVLT